MLFFPGKLLQSQVVALSHGPYVTLRLDPTCEQNLRHSAESSLSELGTRTFRMPEL